MNNLLEKQQQFPTMVAELILFAYGKGYKLTFGEALRTEEQAKIYEEKGIGISNSLHCKKLAIDLNLFKDDIYLDKTEDHLELGEVWESLGGTWGGRFDDGNHYSIEYEGVK